MNHIVLLAQADTEVPSHPFWSSPTSMGPELLILLGAVFVVGFIFFSWAAFWRKPRKNRHSYHVPEDAALPKSRKHRSGLFGRRRHRRRRHHHQQDGPINPTLAQVGGLPPQRRDPPPGP